MIVYLDTSIVVKLYVDEAGSKEAVELADKARILVTSRVAYVEATAAFVRRLAPFKLTNTYHQVKKSFDDDWQKYLIIEVDDNLTRLAAKLAEKHRLRGFDCLHLASALIIKGRLPKPVVFSSADVRLNNAARKEDLPPPE